VCARRSQQPSAYPALYRGRRHAKPTSRFARTQEHLVHVLDLNQCGYAVLFELDQETPAKDRVQFDPRGSWFYEAIGMSVGMQSRVVGFGQVYLETSKDKAGNWLDGGKTYRMRVEPNPPVKQFWSITLYDNVTRGPVITDAGSADPVVTQARSCEER
jgi:hypothetical protein